MRTLGGVTCHVLLPVSQWTLYLFFFCVVLGATKVYAIFFEYQPGPGKKKNLSGQVIIVYGALVYILACEIYVLAVVARFHQALAYFVYAGKPVSFLQ
jgi:hypothetical protein